MTKASRRRSAGAKAPVTGRVGRKNGGNRVDAKVQRAVAAVLDNVLGAVAEAARTRIAAPVREPDSERLRLRLTNAASEMLLQSYDGAEAADAIIDDVIGTLRRALPGQSRQALELLLADVRANAVSTLGEFTAGLIACDRFIDEVVSSLSVDADGDPAPDRGGVPW